MWLTVRIQELVEVLAISAVLCVHSETGLGKMWRSVTDDLCFFFFFSEYISSKKQKEVMCLQGILEHWMTAPYFHPFPLECPICLCASASFSAG